MWNLFLDYTGFLEIFLQHSVPSQGRMKYCIVKIWTLKSLQETIKETKNYARGTVYKVCINTGDMFIKLDRNFNIMCFYHIVCKQGSSSHFRYPVQLLQLICEIVPGNIKGEFREVKRKLFNFEYTCSETVLYNENNNTLLLKQNIHW